MSIRHKGIALLAVAGAIVLMTAGVAGANPMGGTTGTTMMQPGGPTMMQPTTSTTMVQPGGMGGTTGTTMMGPGGGTTGTTMMGPGGLGQGHMFTDVTADDWYSQMAESMASHGFMGGFADGTFGPDRPLTRGQFAGIMARMMNIPASAGSRFSDTHGFWGAGMVETMAQMGVISGRGDGTFGPYDPITREQMAAIMDRAWQVNHGTASPDDMKAAMADMMGRFGDAGSSWAADHIAWMMNIGVIEGDGLGRFRPGDLTSRAEASAMMWRWFEADQAQD